RYNFIMALLIIAGISGCAWFQPGCFIQEQAVKVATDTVVSVLECQNRDVVEKDLKGVVSELGLCDEAQKTGVIADTVCPILVAEVVSTVMEKAIPMPWGCTAIHAKDKVG